ncbi:MAG: hypothetical protein COA95_08715 [Methylophaga sp.]|nr:MAG: hypothetical protein COA95_08715 [Methylophaga sp.]
MKNIALLVVAMLVCWRLFGSDPVVVLGDGVKVAEAPVQTKPLNNESFDYKDFHITPLADFKIKAKILSKTKYRLGREADLSPVDLALGWQNMSDESVLSEIDISQSRRWYRWHVQQLPIPRNEIETQSANMHMVPANDQVADAIAMAKQGQLIAIEGYLIRADADDGWHWQSSLTRKDTGANACELIFVQQFQILN